MAKILRIPVPPVEIILGSLFGAAGFITENIYFELIAEVGFLYLMFLAGMEVDLKQLAQSSKDIIHKSLLFLALLTSFSILSGIIFHLNIVTIISMPLISIGLLASLSKHYGKEQNWIHLAFIVGILGEMMSIASLTIFDAAITTGFNLSLIEKIAYLILFLGSVYLIYRLIHLIFWWFPEFKQALVPKFDTADQDIRLAMALFFMMIALMLFLELELALGAFIAGVAISTFFHHEKRLEEKMSSLGFGFLVPLFFIHVGASLDLHIVFAEGVLLGAMLITLLMLASRLLAAVVLRKIHSSKEALLVALSLSMPLTLMIAVATIGYETKMLDILEYYQLILASIFEILIAMIFIKFLAKREGGREEA
jgi:Kef-type K+ transport system membrane component KefB